MLGKSRGALIAELPLELTFGALGPPARGALEFGKLRCPFIPELSREAIFGLLPLPKLVGGRGTDRCAFPNDGCTGDPW